MSVMTWRFFVFCDCNDFRFRHAKHEPTVNCTDHHCKHLEPAIAQCRQRGKLASAQSFYHQHTAAVVAAINVQSQESKSVNVAYASAIYEAARQAGHDAEYGRVDGSILYRVEVYGMSKEQFSALLKVAGRRVLLAS